MKANHNMISCAVICYIVVVNISSSKNESKSQRDSLQITDGEGCCKYQ